VPLPSPLVVKNGSPDPCEAPQSHAQCQYRMTSSTRNAPCCAPSEIARLLRAAESRGFEGAQPGAFLVLDVSDNWHWHDL